ncbi:unnamed protein product [Lactuca virosa]|uniref:Uncharacterized protein n=1 Tax=Lactuca virosa TaxID=75947 RepID=A0AAU9NCI9_9ASTR|nr:unnamed protein product [Lactuca virosa]
MPTTIAAPPTSEPRRKKKYKLYGLLDVMGNGFQIHGVEFQIEDFRRIEVVSSVQIGEEEGFRRLMTPFRHHQEHTITCVSHVLKTPSAVVSLFLPTPDNNQNPN